MTTLLDLNDLYVIRDSLSYLRDMNSDDHGLTEYGKNKVNKIIDKINSTIKGVEAMHKAQEAYNGVF